VDKSKAIAFILAFLFGPLGLLYVKVLPALILLAVSVVGFFAFGRASSVSLLVSAVVWIVSIVWACVEASRRHREFVAWRASTGGQGVPLPGYGQAAALAYFPGQDAPLPPAGWYPDSVDATKSRWWNGSRWTGDERPVTQPPVTGTVRPDETFPPPGS